MSKTANKPLREPADDLRRTFENAIAQMQQRSERRLSQMPIFDRNRTPARSDTATETQALTDAARALARLWKVSPARVR